VNWFVALTIPFWIVPYLLHTAFSVGWATEEETLFKGEKWLWE